MGVLHEATNLLVAEFVDSPDTQLTIKSPAVRCLVLALEQILLLGLRRRTLCKRVNKQQNGLYLIYNMINIELQV